MRSLLMILVLLLQGGAMAPAALAQGSPGLCARYPTFVGCLPSASGLARSNVLPLSIGDGLRGATVGQILGQVQSSDIAAAVQDGTLKPVVGGMRVLGFPLTPVCPAANCPGTSASDPNAVLTLHLTQGVTTKGNQQEWLAVDSLYSNTGRGTALGQKVGRYVGVVQGPQSGGAWAINTDIVRNGTPNGWDGTAGSGSGAGGTPGAMASTSATIGYELDLSNWDADAAPGGAFVVGHFINTASSFTSLAGIYYGSTGATGWHNGIHFDSNTVKDNVIYEATSASGGVNLAGTHSYGIATSAGTMTYSLIAGAGQSVCLNAVNNCVAYTGGGYRWTNNAGAPVATLSDGGVLKVAAGLDDSSIQYVTPTSGSTVTMSRAAGQLLVINPAGTLAALTVALPASPVHGDVAHIATTQNITSLSLSSAAGIIGNIGNLGAAQTARYRYIGPGSFWLRVN